MKSLIKLTLLVACLAASAVWAEPLPIDANLKVPGLSSATWKTVLTDVQRYVSEFKHRTLKPGAKIVRPYIESEDQCLNQKSLVRHLTRWIAEMEKVALSDSVIIQGVKEALKFAEGPDINWCDKPGFNGLDNRGNRLWHDYQGSRTVANLQKAIATTVGNIQPPKLTPLQWAAVIAAMLAAELQPVPL
ncbi:hypothetical protein D7X74_07690 [Corallococcus sp. CA047B]|uniref:hypothetical protein n=1 Tax=Corallococcus sp. CA047B TaxID=2316729 RepID=UPI000EA0AD73|nr:hypothetical protein [Corallococcus sp. CA047B]RKH19163.1 hypothetical protein D7X74_07690 [Corallococcus sp. CA047B]